MRIALVARGVHPFDSGGRELRVHQLAKNFAKEHKVTVITPFKSGVERPKEFEEFEIRTVSTPIKRPNLMDTIGTPFFARKMQKILEREDFDVVDVLFYSFPFEKDSTKVVASVSEALSIWKHTSALRKFYLLPFSLFRAGFNMAKARFADFVICLSDRSRREAVDAYGISEEKTKTIKNGVDSSLFNVEVGTRVRGELGLDEDTFLLLYAGRLVGEKGVQELIEAVEGYVDDPKVKLIIVGKGSYEWRLSQMASDEILFLGYKPHEKMPEYYSAADLYVLPSHWDVQPLGPIESMACGTPVVSTDVGGIPEVVRDGETGLLVPPKDPKALADKIIEIKEDEDLRRKLIENGLKFTRGRKWEDVAKKTLSVYERLVES